MVPVRGAFIKAWLICFDKRFPGRGVGNERPSSFGIAAKALRGVQNIMTMGQRNGPYVRKEFAMLSLQLKDGEYLTIGEDIVIQVFANSTVRLAVQAPRDMTVLRGEVLERNGEERPDCVFDQKAKNSACKGRTKSKISNG